jgi:hypothetical protein
MTDEHSLARGRLDILNRDRIGEPYPFEHNLRLTSNSDHHNLRVHKETIVAKGVEVVMRARLQERITPEPRETGVQPYSDLQALKHQRRSKLIPDAVLVEIMLQLQMENDKRRDQAR